MIDEKSKVRSCEMMEVICVRSIHGEGLHGDPVREVIQYFAKDGTLLATVDAWKDEQ